ncbi:NAD+ synthase [Methanoplanus sp. FWC-SCC4]|uniref:NH(3)-dependent NAD(+) synthetase n=1 Tax=Methanochimaera problematica TaxID=2609417 RepID=A0AA97I254_9EURY|nr:NAD+ synthase [Methanoplanus sp. FWC-SCC4]WOF15253.1 NAD+ synthase [Methanoplanus sp. FWC-SCC4]
MTIKCIGCECEKIEQMIRHSVWSSGRQKIVIGLSGGIDSSLAAALCSRAIGGENVLGFMLPSGVTPEEDIQDVMELSEKFGISYEVVPINPVIDAFKQLPGYEDSPYLTGNLMARIRMTALYYYANKFSALVCGTSNKTEYMIGYSTKYGDDSADIQPLLHLYKKDVYILSKETGVPESIIKKAPSAGLYPGQSDESEIGFSYEEIDNALINLENSGWTPKSETEEKIFEKVRNTTHKRNAPPNLLKQE